MAAAYSAPAARQQIRHRNQTPSEMTSPAAAETVLLWLMLVVVVAAGLSSRTC